MAERAPSFEGNQKQIEEIQARLRKEVKIVQGAESMLAATTNPDIRAMCEAKIEDAKRSIAYFERSLAANTSGGGAGSVPSSASSDTPPRSSSQSSSGNYQYPTSSSHEQSPVRPGSSPSGSGNTPGYPGNNNNYNNYNNNNNNNSNPNDLSPIKAPRQRYTNLDLLKADTPLTPRRISRMLHQLDFKLHVERQYRAGIDKMAKLYQADGDKRSRADAESKRIESAHKMRLLTQALDRYRALDLGLADEDADEDDDLAGSGSGDPNRDPKGVFRRPLSGTLTVGIRSAKNLQRHPTTARLASRRPESLVVLKVDDSPRARTHPAKASSDRWNEEFQIHVDKANELELAIYDRPMTGPPVPVGMLWIRLSDIVEELRKRKAQAEMQAGGPNNWVTADGMVPPTTTTSGGQSSTTPTPSSENTPVHVTPPQQQQQAGLAATDEGLVAWFGVEPEGRIELHLNFVKSNIRKRPYDATAGGLGRVGALRKRKESIHEQNGHKFVQRQFYQVVLCAYCRDFLLNAAGMQCDDCRYVCHKKCFHNVVTKCISKSISENEKDENKINHRIPHRFEPITSIGPNWCCHCGMILPLGRKKARKCSECDLTAHTDCVHLVPDFCGMSPEVANQLIREVKSINSGRTQRISHAHSSSQQSQTSQQQQPSPVPAQAQAQQQQHHQLPTVPTSSSSTPQDALTSQTGQMSIQDYPGTPDGDAMGYQSGPPPPPPGARPSYAPPPSTGPGQGQQQQGQQYPYPQQQQQQQQQPSGPRPPTFGGSQIPPQQQTPSTSGGPPPRIPLAHQPGQMQMPQVNAYQHAPGSGSGSTPVPPPRPSYPPQQQQPQQQQPMLPQQPPQQQPSQQPQPQQQQQHMQVQQGKVMVPASGNRKVGLDDFNFLAVLGKGNFGKVMLAEERKSNELYAIKVLKKDFIIENDEVESTKSEKRVFLVAAKTRHPFLLGLHSCFQTETRVYFVMEYISGGDLMLHIQREQFTPRRAKFYAAEVLLALEYFHENGIIYRDLKLDNILLTLDGHIKVADYGLCKEDMWYGNTTSTFCGTPEFMAPEILLEQRYTRAVDWWAFGVLIYEMLLGQSPFRGDDEDEIFDAILEDEPLYPIHMPRDSVSILQRLLTRDPQRRLGAGPSDAQEIKAHLFFQGVSWDDMYHKRVPPPYFPQIGSATDVSNFDSEFTSEQPTLTPVHSKLSPNDQKEFVGFSWVAPWAE